LNEDGCKTYDIQGFYACSNKKDLNDTIESEEVLTVAGNLLMNFSKDEVERAILRSRRKFQTDYQSDMATSWDNGVKEERSRVARNLLGMKLPLDQIAEATGLTYEELESLRKEL